MLVNVNLNELKMVLKSMMKEGENYGNFEVNCSELYGYDDELDEITCSQRTITIKQTW